MRFDISFGGATYAVLPASRLGLSMMEAPLADLVRARVEVMGVVRATIPITHPQEPDLGFLAAGRSCEIRGVSGQGFVGTLARKSEGGLGFTSRFKVGGAAFYAGRGEFICEAGDPLTFGFERPERFSALDAPEQRQSCRSATSWRRGTASG